MEVKLYDDSSSGSPEKPSCRCLPGCSEINYQSKITSSKLADTFNATHRFPPLADKKINITYFMCGCSKYLYFNIIKSFFSRENYAIVHLFFTETEVATYQMDEIFGFADFLGKICFLLENWLRLILIF